jgi:hypothetical protein
VLDVILAKEGKSLESKAFEYWLRTGIMLTFDDAGEVIERKFNPYHDPDDGRFTFKPGGGTLPSGVPQSRAGGAVARQRQHGSGSSARRDGSAVATVSNSPESTLGRDENQASLVPAQYRPNPRAGMRGNGGLPLNDPMTLDRVFPGASTIPTAVTSPARAIIGMADNIQDITGPSAALTTNLAIDHSNALIRQIRQVDPSFRHESLRFPKTLDGQMNLIRQLRVERAVAFHRVRGELRPMQVEALRHMQEQADMAYREGVKQYDAGQLRVRLSREEAIGNFVDREVRHSLRRFYTQHGVEVSREGPLRIIGREYDSSGSDLTYRIPDARVGNIAFDVSLTRKTLATPQVRGFFNSDFKPNSVIIIRPRQLGADSTYATPRPRNLK